MSTGWENAWRHHAEEEEEEEEEEVE